jgi:hypothetical protein
MNGGNSPLLARPPFLLQQSACSFLLSECYNKNYQSFAMFWVGLTYRVAGSRAGKAAAAKRLEGGLNNKYIT